MVRIASETRTTKDRRPIVIRSARPSDAAGILEHARAILAERIYSVTEPDELTMTVEEEAAWIEGYREHPGRLAIVAELEGKVVGFLHFAVQDKKRVEHVGSFALSVDADYRNQGIGRLMIEELLAWATVQPTIEKVALGVLSTNERAIALYRKLGFQEEGRKVREIRMGMGEYVDDVLMYKLVGGSTSEW